MKKIIAIFNLMVLFGLCMIQPTKTYSAGGAMNSGKGNSTEEGLPGGPYETKTGWLYYMITSDGNLQTTRTISIANSELPYPVTMNLRSRYGVEPKGKVEYDNQAPWGLPYNADNSGRGPNVKAYLLNNVDTKNKKHRAYNLIYNNFGKAKAEAWENGEELLVFEPFFWHVTKRGGKMFCGTTRTWAFKHFSLKWDYNNADNETKVFVYRYEPGSIFTLYEDEALRAGFKTYTETYLPDGKWYYSRDQMIDPKSNLGIGIVWSGKEPTKPINTYNGKDSPGDPENPYSDPAKQGNTTIVKRYYDRITIPETKKVIYRDVGTYLENNTSEEVIITDEVNKGKKGTEGKWYKLAGWFTENISSIDKSKFNELIKHENRGLLTKIRELYSTRINVNY